MEKKEKNVIRVGGVPEHFNEVWMIGIEEKIFENEGLTIEWHSIKEGTGAMINQLKSNEVDIIVALTEGLINEIAHGSTIRLIGTYVQSSLRWSVSTSVDSKYQSIEDLKGQRFGISRYQSGSHLMSCVLANQYGWKDNDIQFVVNHNIDNLIKSVRDNQTDAFIWEYFMQKPYYDRGDIRSIGEIITPWPCFLIASTEDYINENENLFRNLFIALEKSCQIFAENSSSSSIKRICQKFHLNETDAREWFEKVNIIGKNEIAESTIERTLDALYAANLIEKENQKFNPIDFLNRKIAKLTVDIKSMRLYNKPELIISLRNYLRNAHLSKGSITYQDLLPYDQNHYYGTDVLDLAVKELQLNQIDQTSSWIIQIGSNLGGCSRYLAGKYQLKVLAIELQHDLSQEASQLTERTGLNHLVHHITGNFLDVAQHFQENFYQSIVSWLTILHFNENERLKLFEQSYRLLKENGSFYFEDFIEISPLTNEESQILEHDVYCTYLSNLDQYKDQLIKQGFRIQSVTILTEQWKIFTQQRFNDFHLNQNQLIEIHGEDLYHRLEYFYKSIAQLFQGNHLGGVRIHAIKQFKSSFK